MGNSNERVIDLETAAYNYRQVRDEPAMEEVARTGEALVTYFAGLHSPAGRRDEDLIQVGYEGLLKALKRYDPSREVRFTTYASHCIIGEIRRELKRRNAFRVPEWIQTLQARISQATEELIQENGAIPALSEIAARVNVAKEGIEQAMLAGSISLEEIDWSRVKNIHYESFKLPIEDVITVRMALERLESIQKKVLQLIFYQDLTQEQVARRMGLHQRKVSRLLVNGLRAMRRLLE
ncbi:MAG: sigma-70 family RNA polymerase sigma factor [Bacillota bacterium]